MSIGKCVIFYLKKNENLIIVAVLLSLSYLLFGKYWGWIDDILFNNIYSGYFYSGSMTTKYLIFFSEVIAWLYTRFPSFNWYSIILHFYLFVSLYYIVSLLLDAIRNAGIRNRVAYLIIFCFYFAFLVEPYLYISFTYASVLGAGAVLVYYIYKANGTGWGLLVLGFSAVLVRSEAAVMIFPLLFIISVSGDRKIYKGILSVAVLFILSIGVFFKPPPKDLEKISKYEKKLRFLLDNQSHRDNMFNNQNMHSQADSIKLLSVVSWFTGDIENQLSGVLAENSNKENILHKIAGISPLSKLKMEYYRACCSYDQTYTPYRNWAEWGIVYILIGFFIVVWSSFRNPRWYINLTLFFTFLAILFSALVVYKIEYRILHPVFIVFLLCLIAVNNKLANTKIFAILLVSSLSVLPFRFAELVHIKRVMEIEVQQKKKIRDEILTLKDKIILFDITTMSIQYPGMLFSDYRKPEGSILLTYGEFYSNMSQKHLEYLKEICESSEMLPFFKCLYKKKDKVVFVLTEHRISMYSSYFKYVFGENLKFKLLENQPSELGNLRYSYDNHPLSMNYYVFDESFEDYYE